MSSNSTAVKFEVLPVYIPLLENRSKYLVLKGGGGSGKSYFAAQKLIIRLISEPEHRFLVFRKVSKDLRGSVYNDLSNTIKNLGIESDFIFQLSPLMIKHKPSGNEIVFRGLDDEEKLKSIQGITGAWVEEATEFSADEIDQISMRLRKRPIQYGEEFNNYLHYNQIILSFNPVSVDHWIKERFFDNPDQQTYTISTTYKDNPYLPEDNIRTMENWRFTNPLKYMVYALGNWGELNTEGSFYRGFDYGFNVEDNIEYDSSLPLWLSFDFNTFPYCAGTVWQLKDNAKTLVLIDEIVLNHPENTTKFVCDEFKKRYFSHASGLYVTGDANGRNNDTRSEVGFNDYKIIEQVLAKFRPTFRHHSKNPSVKMRGDFINEVLTHSFKDLKIIFSSSCKHTIEDFTYLKQAADGTKDKTKVKDKKTKISYERYGHLSDSADYLITKAFEGFYIEYQRGTNGFKFATGTRTLNNKFYF